MRKRVRTKDRKILAVAKCRFKRRYTSYEDAGAWLGKQHVYFCSRCDGYHRTSYPLDADSERRTLKKAGLLN